MALYNCRADRVDQPSGKPVTTSIEDVYATTTTEELAELELAMGEVEPELSSAIHPQTYEKQNRQIDDENRSDELIHQLKQTQVTTQNFDYYFEQAQELKHPPSRIRVLQALAETQYGRIKSFRKILRAISNSPQVLHGVIMQTHLALINRKYNSLFTEVNDSLQHELNPHLVHNQAPVKFMLHLGEDTEALDKLELFLVKAEDAVVFPPISNVLDLVQYVVSTKSADYYRKQQTQLLRDPSLKAIHKEIFTNNNHKLKWLRTWLKSASRISELVYDDRTAHTRYIKEHNEEKRQLSYEVEQDKFNIAGELLTTLYSSLNAIHGYTRVAYMVKKIIHSIYRRFLELRHEIAPEYLAPPTYESENESIVKLKPKRNKEQVIPQPTPKEAKLLGEIKQRLHKEVVEEKQDLIEECVNELELHCDPSVKHLLGEGETYHTYYSERLLKIYQVVLDTITDIEASRLDFSFSYLRYTGCGLGISASNSRHWNPLAKRHRRFVDLSKSRNNQIMYAARFVVESGLVVATDTFFIETLDGVLAVALFVDIADWRVVDYCIATTEKAAIYTGSLERMRKNPGGIPFLILMSDQTSGMMGEQLVNFYLDNGALPSVSVEGNPTHNHHAERTNNSFKSESKLVVHSGYENETANGAIHGIACFAWWYNEERIREDTIDKTKYLPDVSRMASPNERYQASIKRNQLGAKLLGIRDHVIGLGWTVGYDHIWFHPATCIPEHVHNALPIAAISNLAHHCYYKLDDVVNQLRYPVQKQLALEHAQNYVKYSFMPAELKQKLNGYLNDFSRLFNKDLSLLEKYPTVDQQFDANAIAHAIINQLHQHVSSKEVEVIKVCNLEDQIAGRASFIARHLYQINTGLLKNLTQVLRSKHKGEFDKLYPKGIFFSDLKAHFARQGRFKNLGLLDKCMFNTAWPTAPYEDVTAKTAKESSDNNAKDISGNIVPEQMSSEPAVPQQEQSSLSELDKIDRYLETLASKHKGLNEGRRSDKEQQAKLVNFEQAASQVPSQDSTKQNSVETEANTGIGVKPLPVRAKNKRLIQEVKQAFQEQREAMKNGNPTKVRQKDRRYSQPQSTNTKTEQAQQPTTENASE